MQEDLLEIFHGMVDIPGPLWGSHFVRVHVLGGGLPQNQCSEGPVLPAVCGRNTQLDPASRQAHLGLVEPSGASASRRPPRGGERKKKGEWNALQSWRWERSVLPPSPRTGKEA